VSGARVRQWWLLVPGIGGQVAADHLASGHTAQTVLVGSYVVLGLFLWANRFLVGIGLMAVGLVCNAAVVVADSGMPVRPSAIVSAGLAGPDGPAAPPQGARHHLQGPSDHLVLLDDRIPVHPLHRVVSYGDVLLLVGALDVVAHLAFDGWGAAEPRRGGRRHSLTIANA
jgi:hypothetical protein